MATKPSHSNMNVFKKPLAFFSNKPLTGFYRDGYCRTGPDDHGNHAVAAVVTDEFLTFSASRGNDLRTIGLTGGCKWCLCTNRWKEAMLVAKGSDDPVVPKVFLHATDESALKSLDMKDLEKFAHEGEVGSGYAGQRTETAKTPSDKPGAAVRETH
ncbi:MAG: hypothetical protein MMC33_000205 [Icmadophila ericetorum]|nr:hypothetical protein [Icmadophila ericetorum]